MWDTIRVDQEKEFYLCLYTQEKNADKRRNTDRQAFNVGAEDRLPMPVGRLDSMCEVWYQPRVGGRPRLASNLRTNNLLEDLSSDLQKDMKKELQGKVVTLVEDGWSNVQTDPVTATCIHVNGNSFFVNATSEKKTAEYCKHQCSVTITEIQDMYDC